MKNKNDAKFELMMLHFLPNYALLDRPIVLFV